MARSSFQVLYTSVRAECETRNMCFCVALSFSFLPSFPRASAFRDGKKMEFSLIRFLAVDIAVTYL